MGLSQYPDYSSHSINDKSFFQADNIYDIIHDVDFDIKDNCITLKYQDTDLAYCSFHIYGTTAVVDEFYTSNYTGLKKGQDKGDIIKLKTLDKPIKYLGKELFCVFIRYLQAKGVDTICLVYRQETNSLDFYKKMLEHFSNDILKISEPMLGSLVIKLV